MYKIHSKLVFFLKKILKKLTKTKLNTLYNNNKKKSVHAVQVNSARELHCSLFLSEQCNLLHCSHEQCITCTVHVNCTVH
jgi:hypothetical protein